MTSTTTTGTAASPSTAPALGGPEVLLEDDAVVSFIGEQLGRADLDGRSVCVLVPDTTRTCPMPLLLSAVHAALHGRVTRLTVLVALGTHAGLTEETRAAHLGYRAGDLDGTYPGTTVIDHEWWEPSTFVDVGTITAERVGELSNGLLGRTVPVRVNRAVVEHDVALVLGPVFPHEVVGFSGGNKYLFPGVGGPELIDTSHWLGALISSAEIIGTTGTTPVRALIDDAAALLPIQRLALCVVVDPGTAQLRSVHFGAPETAWAAAAQVSAGCHVHYLDAPVRRVLSILPTQYDDMWTGAKGFYKVEPVVADGGEVVILAPHITEIARTHPTINEIGYHCRDYFVAQWDRFSNLPWGEIAHSTHLHGAGTYDPVDGERARVKVTLATAIPEATVRAVNLGHLDPTSIDIEEWAADPDTLVIPKAGEVLYRLRPTAG